MKETDQISVKKINNFDGYKKNYAKSKLIIENELKTWKKGFNVSIARLFTFIGKKILINKNFAIYKFVKSSKRSKVKEYYFNL